MNPTLIATSTISPRRGPRGVDSRMEAAIEELGASLEITSFGAAQRQLTGVAMPFWAALTATGLVPALQSAQRVFVFPAFGALLDLSMAFEDPVTGARIAGVAVLTLTEYEGQVRYSLSIGARYAVNSGEPWPEGILTGQCIASGSQILVDLPAGSCLQYCVDDLAAVLVRDAHKLPGMIARCVKKVTTPIEP